MVGARCLALGLGLVLAAPLSLPPGSASAQDDWGLTRERRRPTRRARPRRSRPPSRRRPARPRRARPRPPRPETTPAAPLEGDAPDRSDRLIARYRGILEASPNEAFAFRRLLELYRQRDGNIEALVTDLESQAQAEPDAYAPPMILGHVFRSQGRLMEARASYRRASSLQPRDAAPYQALAEVERADGQAEAARDLYREALGRTSERLARQAIQRELAALSIELGDYDGARRTYDALAAASGGSIYLRTELARAFAERGAWEQAVAEYRRVLGALRGDNRVLPPVLLALARAELELGEADQAIATLDRGLRLAGPRAGVRTEIYDALLEAHRRTDRLPELAERLRREAGRGFEAAELLARIEDELGRDEEALAADRRALRLRPRDIDTRLRLIQLLSRSGRLDDVVAEYRVLIRNAPREPRFVIDLAQLLHETDRSDEALELLRRTGAGSRDPALHLQLAELYNRWGEEELAAAEVELLARIDPREPAHVVALGSQRYAEGRVQEAISIWRRVLTVVPERAEAHAVLAGILADHDLLDQAIAEYRGAVRLAPDQLEYVRGLATVLERHRQPDDAERQWRRVLQLAADDPSSRREARERIVGIWARRNRTGPQMEALTEALAADPPDLEAGRLLAEALRRGGGEGAERAESVLETILEHAPGDVESLLALERLRTQRGDLAGAIAALGRLRDVDPRHAARYLQRMAQHALSLYRDEEALRYAAEAVEHNPDDAMAHRRLAELYRARQDGDRAVASYRRALALNDRLYTVYFELSELHLARGETDEADRRYREVLAITPDDDLVQRAARASIQIHLGAATLPVLERALLPLAIANPRRQVYRRMVVELYEAYAGPLVLAARRDGEAAGEARQELRRIGTRGIKPLLEALADPDPSQREVALAIIGELGNPAAAAPLLAVSENGSLDGPTRVRALLAAATVAPERLTPRFASLARGTDPRLSGPATWALARLGGREALSALRELLGGTQPQERVYAAIGLGRHGTSADVRRLVSVLAQLPAGPVHEAALWAIGRRGSSAQVRTVAAFLGQSGGPVAAAASESLGALGGPDAEEALAGALFDPDRGLRRAVGRALRRSMAGGVEDAPLPAPRPFEPYTAYVRRVIRDPRPLPPVDPTSILPRAQEAATAALRGAPEHVLAGLMAIEGEGGRFALGAVTDDWESWPEPQRTRAGVALSAFREALLPALLDLAERPDETVRVAVVGLLATYDDPRAAGAVSRLLSEPSTAVRRAALDAVARAPVPLGSELGVELALILERSREWSMRTRAAEALGRVADVDARDALARAAAEDRYAFVREAAVRALGRRDDGRAELLRVLADDPEPAVRAAAGAALLARGGDDAAAARPRLEADPDPTVRQLLDPPLR